MGQNPQPGLEHPPRATGALWLWAVLGQPWLGRGPLYRKGDIAVLNMTRDFFPELGVIGFAACNPEEELGIRITGVTV